MQREGHESEIINMVRTSLVDDDAIVKTAAAKHSIRCRSMSVPGPSTR